MRRLSIVWSAVSVWAVLALIVAAPARAALVGHWAFETGSGTTAFDSGTGGNDGTLLPAGNPPVWVPASAPVPSGSTYALDFDGNNDRIEVVGYKGIGGTQPRTMSVWIKTPTTGNLNREMISWGLNQGGKKWIFRVQDSNGTPGTIRTEVNGGYIVGTTPVADGQWHHVAAVLPVGVDNVQDMALYVDGLFDAPSARQGKQINTDTSSQDVRIGIGHSGNNFPGQMDDVRVYDEALTPRQIWDLAHSKTPQGYRQKALADGAVAYWRLGETAGTTAYNEVPGGAQGTYNNGVVLNQPSLLITDPNPSAAFDGTNDHIRLDDSPVVNTGTFVQKSAELWFKADTTAGRQVLYEQGGKTRGLNLYVEDGRLYYNAWNLAESDWGPAFVSTPIEPDRTYHALMSLDGDPDGDANTDDGILSAYLNGELIGTAAGAGVLRSHGDDGAIGAMIQNSWFHDGGPGSSDGFYFQGMIDEVAIYNVALTGEQAREHYEAGIPEPATLALAGLAAAGLGGYVRRRRRA